MKIIVALVLFIVPFARANAEEVIENLGGFVAGTIVQTANGPDTIQSIRVNDRVLSQDLKTGKIIESRVVDVFQETVDELAKVVIEDEEFYVNPDHRFYIADSNQWLSARLLVPGQHKLLSKKGTLLNVNAVELIGGRSFIYDFTVEDTANYFVGKTEVLVHNFVFAIPLATWVIGEGLVFLSAATLATIAASVAVGFAVDYVGRVQEQDYRTYQPSSRYEWDLAQKGKTFRNRLQPDSTAEGDHSTFRPGPDGTTEHYETWRDKGSSRHSNDPNRWESEKRFDRTGENPHFNKATREDVGFPHVHDPKTPGGVRPAEGFEVPR